MVKNISDLHPEASNYWEARAILAEAFVITIISFISRNYLPPAAQQGVVQIENDWLENMDKIAEKYQVKVK